MKKDIVGEVSEKDAIDCKQKELANKKIVIYENDRKHCYKRHYNDFNDSKVFRFVMENLGYIIEEKDFVLYNKNNSSLEYYKKLDQNVSVRVKVENSNELKIKTVFTISDIKYENKKNKSIYNKYIIEDEESSASN